MSPELAVVVVPVDPPADVVVVAVVEAVDPGILGIPGIFILQNVYFLYDRMPPPSCSKHRQLNKLVSGQNVYCSSKYNI